MQDQQPPATSSAGSTPCDVPHLTSGTASPSIPQIPQPEVPAGSRPSGLVLAHQGLQFFSGTQLQHRLAVGFLQVLELALVLIAHVLGLGTQGVLHPALAVIDPTLD